MVECVQSHLVCREQKLLNVTDNFFARSGFVTYVIGQHHAMSYDKLTFYKMSHKTPTETVLIHDVSANLTTSTVKSVVTH